MGAILKSAIDTLTLISQYAASIFPEDGLLHTIALVGIFLVGNLLIFGAIGAICGLALAIIWRGFKRVFQVASGRPFIFTRRMAFVLSSSLAALLICALAFQLFHAIQTGEILAGGGRGGPPLHKVFLNTDRGAFIWAAIEQATTLSSLWVMSTIIWFRSAVSP